LKRNDLQTHLSRLDLGEVEDVVDHGEELVGAPSGHYQMVSLMNPVTEVPVAEPPPPPKVVKAKVPPPPKPEVVEPPKLDPKKPHIFEMPKALQPKIQKVEAKAPDLDVHFEAAKIDTPTNQPKRPKDEVKVNNLGSGSAAAPTVKLPVEKVQSMTEVISESLSHPRFQTWLLCAVAGAGLALRDAVVDSDVPQRQRHGRHQVADEEQHQDRLDAQGWQQRLAEDAPCVARQPVVTPGKQQQRKQGRGNGQQEHPRAKAPEQYRVQVGEVAGEAEAVEAEEHHRAEAAEVGQFVDEQQQRDGAEEEKRRESGGTLEVEEDVGVEERPKHEVQRGLTPSPQPAQRTGRLHLTVVPGVEAEQQQARQRQVGALLDEEARVVDAPHHECIEGEAPDEEEDVLDPRVAMAEGF